MAEENCKFRRTYIHNRFFLTLYKTSIAYIVSQAWRPGSNIKRGQRAHSFYRCTSSMFNFLVGFFTWLSSRRRLPVPEGLYSDRVSAADRHSFKVHAPMDGHCIFVSKTRYAKYTLNVKLGRFQSIDSKHKQMNGQQADL